VAIKPWQTALVCMVCQAMGIGLLSVFGFFVEPLAAEFDVGVATISVGAVFLLVAPALVGPLAGRYADSHSIRNIMLLGVAISASCLLIIARAPVLLVATLGFFCYASGQALYGPVILNSLLVKTYGSNIARALSIAAMGTSIGAVLLPFGAAWLLDHYSWREVLVVIAVLVCLLLFTAIRFGLSRDLVRATADAQTHSETPIEANRGFLKQRAFWLIGISVSIIFNAALMAGVSYAPHFSQLDFARSDIAVFIAAGGVAGFTAKVLVAVYADGWRDKLRLVAVGFCIVGAGGFLLLFNGESFMVIVTATFLVGAAGGGFIPLHPFLNSVYFDAASIGRINGAQAPMFLPLGLVSAPLAGYAFDVTGSYAPAYATVVGAFLLAALLFALLPRPAGE
jgi:predicted MFS family arabinose efflux permease